MAWRETVNTTVEKCIVARNALVARYTYEHLGEDRRRNVDEHILELLVMSGIDAQRVAKYKQMLRETQFFCMVVNALASLKIRPALTGILVRERWAHVKRPLVALSGAEVEIHMGSQSILKKHRILVTISDDDKQPMNWQRLLQLERQSRHLN